MNILEMNKIDKLNRNLDKVFNRLEGPTYKLLYPENPKDNPFEHTRACGVCSRDLICQAVYDLTDEKFLYNWCMNCNRKFPD